MSRQKKNIFVFIGIHRLDLAFKVFLAEKSEGRGGSFKRLRCIFYIEMREIDCFVLKYSQLSISQSKSSSQTTCIS